MKWIPVTERLPEKDGWYLVTIHDSHDNLMILMAKYYPNLKTFEGFVREALDAIAWMPFPKPYNPNN